VLIAVNHLQWDAESRCSWLFNNRFALGRYTHYLLKDLQT
jgi:hypothetical protein